EASRIQRDFAGLKLTEASMIMHNFTNIMNSILSRKITTEQQLQLARSQFQSDIRQFSKHLLENQNLLLNQTDHLLFTTLNLARAEDNLGQEEKAIQYYKQIFGMINDSKSKKNRNNQYYKVSAATGLSEIYSRHDENEKAIEILESVWSEIIVKLKSGSELINKAKIGPHESEVAINLYLLYEKTKLPEKSKSIQEELNQFIPGFDFKKDAKPNQ
ncbi:MAG: hypothetical protein ACKO0V_14830, partial [bacterium]